MKSSSLPPFFGMSGYLLVLGRSEKTSPNCLWPSSQFSSLLGLLSCVPACINALCTQHCQNRCEFTFIVFGGCGLWQPVAEAWGSEWPLAGAHVLVGHCWGMFDGCWLLRHMYCCWTACSFGGPLLGHTHLWAAFGVCMVLLGCGQILPAVEVHVVAATNWGTCSVSRLVLWYNWWWLVSGA